MKNIRTIIISSLVLALNICFISCTEKMDINVDNAPPQLVIYGGITTDTTNHVITIRRSSNYFSNSEPEGISGAVVTISDGDTIFTLSERPSERGVYQTAPDVFGVEGKTYTLKVVVDFDGVTDEYEATSLMPYSVQLDSVVLQNHETGFSSVDALLYGRFPADKNNYLNIVAYKNDGIPLNDKLSNFNIIVCENTDSRAIDGLICMNFRTGNDQSRTSITHGDRLIFQVRSITKEYANYVLNVQKELQWSIPIFSGPPTNVETNLKARNSSSRVPVCGFFTAYSKQSREVLFENK